MPVLPEDADAMMFLPPPFLLVPAKHNELLKTEKTAKTIKTADTDFPIFFL
jgi:hypothetical protein